MQPCEQNAYSRSGISRVSPFSRASSTATIMSQTGSRSLGPETAELSFIASGETQSRRRLRRGRVRAAEVWVDEREKLLFRHVAHAPLGLVAVLEHDQRGDPSDANAST